MGAGAVVGVVALLLARCAPSSGGEATGADESPLPGRATVYYVLAEPRPDGADPWAGDRATLLSPRTVEVDPSVDPAVAAVRTLMTEETPGPGLVNSPVARFGRPPFDVLSVEHEDGLVTVDLTADLYDPCPACGIVLTSSTESIVQQYVLTAQTAFGTDDPVRFTARGEPARGLWFERLRGPVEGDPGLVVPPRDPASPVAAAGLATPDRPPGPVMEALVGGVVRRDDDGCVGLDAGAGVRPVVWPHGWSAWQTRDGVVVLDEAGLLAAREGDRVVGSGGTVPSDVDSPCLPGGGAEVVHLQASVELQPRTGRP